MPEFRVVIEEVTRYYILVEAADTDATAEAAEQQVLDGTYAELEVTERDAIDVTETHGYRVHHDMHGWYVVAPREREPADGRSLGFDGRAHYASEEDAWVAVAKRRGRARV